MRGGKSDAGGPEKQLILFVWPNITGKLHFLEHEDDCMETYPLGAWLQVLGLMVMACRLLNIV